MPDGSISVKITAEASGFTDGARKTGSAVEQIAAKLALLQSEMRAASAETRKRADEIRNTGGTAELQNSLAVPGRGDVLGRQRRLFAVVSFTRRGYGA